MKSWRTLTQSVSASPRKPKMRVFPRRHRSIPSGLPVVLSSTTYASSVNLIAPAGLEPARGRLHREAPSRLHAPNRTERNGTTRPPAVRFPHHGPHGGAKLQEKVSANAHAVLAGPNAYISRPASRRHPLGVRICCARLLPSSGGSTFHGYLTVRMSIRLASRGVYHGAPPAQRGGAPDRKKDKGEERRLRKRDALAETMHLARAPASPRLPFTGKDAG